MTRRQLLEIGGLACIAKPVSPQTTHPSLLAAAKKCGHHIGAVADNKSQLQVPEWADFVTRNFDTLSIAKFKLGFIRPKSEAFDFSETDWLVDFAHRNRLLIHGHNLCWNSSNPAWLGSTLTQANARGMLIEHITAVMKRYAGQIDSWDVVNEPIATWMNQPEGLYKGPWLDVLGPDYIDIAFSTAAAVDPRALRILNIHHVEQAGKSADDTRRVTLALVQRLLSKKVPIQAIGFESHLVATDPITSGNRDDFIKRLRDLGLEIVITELDVDDSKVPGDIPTRDRVVAQYYGDYIAAMKLAADPSAVIFFTPNDRNNWYDHLHAPQYDRVDGAKHRPGLLDDGLRPKPAYFAARDALAKCSKG